MPKQLPPVIHKVTPGDGIMPLDLFITCMREDWAQYLKLKEEVEATPEPEKRKELATEALEVRERGAKMAERAAPFVHSKLATATIKDERPRFVLDVDGMSDTEIETALKVLKRIVRPADDVGTIVATQLTTL